VPHQVLGNIATRNISTIDEILSHLFLLRNKIVAVITCRKAYRNFFSVAKHSIKNEFPIEAELRDGTRTSLINRYNVWYYARSINFKGINSNAVNNIVTLSQLPYLEDGKTEIKLYGATFQGDVPYIFYAEEYDFLQVRGKTVVDVGGNIADAAIYFATKGAKKVVSLEPFPKVYELAKKNIELNNLSDKINLLLAGCSGSLGEITVDPEFDSEIDTRLREFEQGIKIPLLTLESISKENNIHQKEGVLKMDCEECEYDSILLASEETLQNFSHIMIEYHHGYKNLKQKLEKSNFHVRATRPNAAEGGQRVGYIYAKQA
jgi:FkbM family methyltransferase